MFANKEFVQTLDKADAARTLAAYDLKYLNQQLHNRHRRHISKSKIFSCKPFKCGMCEFRSAQKSNASTHMRLVHKVDSNAAKRLVKVLPLDEAKSTAEEYNKKFVKSGRFFYNSTTNDDHAEDIFQIDQNTQQDNARFDEANLSSEEEEHSQTEPEVENRLKTQLQHGQTTIKNKKFKCVKCHYRANWWWFISKHFKIEHREVKFKLTECVQVLDEDEATRTLVAYERNQASKSMPCKPYKCGKCEYRTGNKPDINRHLRQIHRAEFREANMLVKVLPLEEAAMTVNDYNNKFAGQKSYSCSKLRLKRDEKTESTASNSGAIRSNIQPGQVVVCNKKFKCVKCDLRSNWRWYVSMHFRKAHSEVVLSSLKCVEVLDEDEATRTLEAYERNHANDRIVCKPFLCGKCEYRTGRKSHAYRHMCQVHKVEFYEAKKLVKVLSLDEANKTIGEYNKRFASKNGLFRPKLLLEGEENTGPAPSNSDATSSKAQNSFSLT
jgi:KRAB domain-containing zinc finger protein